MLADKRGHDALFQLEDFEVEVKGKGSVTIACADQYTILFSRCQDVVEVTMDVRTEMYNVVGGNGIEYLLVGLLSLCRVFAVAAVVYFAILVPWFFLSVRKRATA